MRRFVGAIAVVLAGAWIMTATDTKSFDPAEFGDHATGMRLLSAKGTNVNAAGVGASATLF